jgi:hypothetical protein
VGPLVLIFLGCIFLLQNAGYLPSNFWLSLWRLWPVILVLAGVELLLAGRIPWVLLAGVSAAVLVLGAVAIHTPTVLAPAQPSTVTSQTTDLGGAHQAALSVQFDAGELNIGAIERPVPGQLATAGYSGPQNLAPTPTYSVSGDVGLLAYAAGGDTAQGLAPLIGSQSGSPRLDLSLSPMVPITSLSVKSGASNGHLDLSTLQLKDFDASLGAAATWIRVPQNAGPVTLRISGGASDISIDVPPGVAARLRFRGGLTTINVDQARFPPAGDNVYQSADFGTAPNSADITIDAGVTKIQVT